MKKNNFIIPLSAILVLLFGCQDSLMYMEDVLTADSAVHLPVDDLYSADSLEARVLNFLESLRPLKQSKTGCKQIIDQAIFCQQACTSVPTKK